ncbi:MAG: hypothetical protein RBR07_06540, partial [Arcobacteraceae bacterium]|nr:hypothetical protein [Arcobacteraceae bacterium]
MSIISSSTSSASAYSAMMATTQPTKPSGEDFASFLVSSLDQNSDSALTIDELELSEEDFASLDTDGDGSLSIEELTETISAKLQELEASKPSKEEFATMMQEMG